MKRRINNLKVVGPAPENRGWWRLGSSIELLVAELLELSSSSMGSSGLIHGLRASLLQAATPAEFFDVGSEIDVRVGCFQTNFEFWVKVLEAQNMASLMMCPYNKRGSYRIRSTFQ